MSAHTRKSGIKDASWYEPLIPNMSPNRDSDISETAYVNGYVQGKCNTVQPVGAHNF